MPRLTVTIEDKQSELLEELSGESGEYVRYGALIKSQRFSKI